MKNANMVHISRNCYVYRGANYWRGRRVLVGLPSPMRLERPRRLDKWDWLMLAAIFLAIGIGG